MMLEVYFSEVIVLEYQFKNGQSRAYASLIYSFYT